MKRTHKKSMFAILAPNDLEKFRREFYIMQVEAVGDNVAKYLVEYLADEDAQEYLTGNEPTPAKSQVDMDYENALSTVLNNDPRGIYTGCTLAEIFADPNGKKWVEWALANMKNEFIRQRVKIIAERYTWQ